MGLGSLDRLPLELLHDTLFRLDLHSLFKFRQTNLRSRQMADSLNQYQMVITHGVNILCALLRTRLAISITPEGKVQTLAAARKQLHLTKAQSVQLTSFKALPGIYTMNESTYKCRIAVVSAHQASLICR